MEKSPANRFHTGISKGTIMIGLLLTLSLSALSTCLSQIAPIEDRTNSWIGRPIEEIRRPILRPESYASRIGWKEKTYKLDSGNWVYVEPDSPGCFIHWEVNPQGIIVGYKLEGRCY
jgi:hypothetical protein